MESKDYKKAASFFSRLLDAANNSPPGNVKDIERIIKNYPNNPAYAIDALNHALQGLDRYNKIDLEYLQNAGFDIDEAVIGLPRASYSRDAKELVPHLNRINISTKKFLEHSKDKLDMFSRFLRAYADISEYEAKVLNIKKTETLKRVLESKFH